MTVDISDIDAAKHVFQVAALNRGGRPEVIDAARRANLIDGDRRLEPTISAMETCGSDHYWGRMVLGMSEEVRLISPQEVQPFVRIDKTYAGDVVIICVTA